MIGISQIRLVKHETSSILLADVKKVISQELKKVAPATKFRILEHDEQLSIGPSRPISLQTINKLIHNLQEKRIKIKKFSWEEYGEGPIRRGKMYIIIS